MKRVLKNSVEEPEKQIFTDELQIYSGEGFPEHSAPTKDSLLVWWPKFSISNFSWLLHDLPDAKKFRQDLRDLRYTP